MNSELVTSVSFQDCVAELVDSGSNSAKEAFEAWKRRSLRQPEFAEVIALVEGLTHTFLYTISEKMLEETKASSEHALGDLRKETAEDERIENFATPFALHHLFHFFVEQSAQLPTWQMWWKWLTLGEGKRYYIARIQSTFRWATLPELERAHLRDALRWRLGKFYYSAFREVELLTKLRTRHGLSVKYHVLADVLLRADLWLGKTIVCLFFENPRYRKGNQGRKPRAQYFLQPPFDFVEVTLSRQGFGTFWTVSEEDLESLASQIKHSLDGRSADQLRQTKRE